MSLAWNRALYLFNCLNFEKDIRVYIFMTIHYRKTLNLIPLNVRVSSELGHIHSIFVRS